MTVEEFIAQWHDDAPTVPVYTSGSTGRPKLMHAEKARMRASARMTCAALGLKAGDRALLCLPMDYIAGKMMAVRCLEMGLEMRCVAPSGHPLADVADDERIDFAAMVPLQVYNALADEREARKLRAVRHLLIGGGAIDAHMEAALRTFPHAVWSSYGMTETLSHIALRRVNSRDEALRQWYTPLPGVTVSTAPDGCLVIDAPAVCPVALHTHDVALIRRDDAGAVQSCGDDAAGAVLFRILGRKDNVICSGGVKIQIEEVEAALAPHLAQPFIVTKRPSEKYGEALVLLTEDADVEGVEALCRRVLPRYWQPRAVIRVERVPLTETGKPARAVAEEMAATIISK